MSSICTGLVLIYFGVTTYYFAPEAAIKKDTYSFVMIMNRILMLMIVGFSIIANLFQNRMEKIIEFFLFHIVRKDKNLKKLVRSNLN